MKTKPILILFCAIALGALAAEPSGVGPATKSTDSKQLFPDDLLCKGKGVEVKRSQVDEAYLQFKSNMNARGQPVPPERRTQIESQLLDRLVVTELLVSRATDEDRKNAAVTAGKFFTETKEKAGSEESFQRQLKAMNFTPEQFRAQVMERAVCEEVIDRELKTKVTVTDAQADKFYETNGDQFQRPEMVRAAHILISTRDPISGQEIAEDQKKEKKRQIEKLLERSRKGEDFAALAKQYSEDPGSKDKGGEYTFPRGQMVPEFESAAFSLNTNQISDVITTQFGYHIIKVYEKLPSQKVALATVRADLKEQLARQEVQKQLPGFLEKLKREANLQYSNGATAPPETVIEDSHPKPTESSQSK